MSFGRLLTDVNLQLRNCLNDCRAHKNNLPFAFVPKKSKFKNGIITEKTF